MTKEIKIKMIEKNIQLKELAEKLNTSSPNLSQKLARDNFSTKELDEIAKALNCKFVGKFIDLE